MKKEVKTNERVNEAGKDASDNDGKKNGKNEEDVGKVRMFTIFSSCQQY